jgi:Tol biopolymer transport system component
VHVRSLFAAAFLIAVIAGCGGSRTSRAAPLIAFEAPGSGGNESLWVVSSDGGKPRELIRNVWGVFGSAWSPDGSRLAVTVNEGDGADIFVVNSNGSGLTRITRGGHTENVSWAPNGRLLAFEWTANRIDGATWVDIANTDGTNIHRPTSKRLDGDTHWSPSRGQLTVDDTLDATYVIDLSTRRVVHRFPTNVLDLGGTWSPDGGHVAFAASSQLPNGTFREDLYVRDVQRSHARRLVFPDLYADAPAWSPNGKLIAFDGTHIHCARGCEAIFVVRPDGTGLRRLTPYSGESAEPSWSETGDQIAYVGARSAGISAGFESFGRASIYVMHANGTDRRRLVGLPEPDNLGPLSWQPSG